MRVAHISTYDIQGGAARSAWRLHQGLLAQGLDSRIVAREKSIADDHVVAATLDNGWYARRQHRHWMYIQAYWIDRNRTDVSNTHFSIPYPGWNLAAEPEVRHADIVNVHWPWWLMSPRGIADLCRLAPVVWTFHDQRAFTGGCHFSAGCSKFKTDCSGCPQLLQDPHGMIPAALADSVSALEKKPITVVTPSRWLAGCAKQSAAFKEHRVEIIPYGIDTDVYQPHPRASARKQFSISPDQLCLLVGADNPSEKRKGFEHLAKALKLACQNEIFAEGVRSGRIHVLLFGSSKDQKPPELGVPVTDLGRLSSEQDLARLYSAADVVVLPSLDDNLPNVMLEAMSCGTPVVGHSIGGIPDVVVHGRNGLLADAGAPASLADAITSIAGNDVWRAELAKRTRSTVLERHTLAHQASAYRNLYAELVEQRRFSLRLPRLTNRRRFVRPGPNMAKILGPLLAEARPWKGKREP